MMVWPLAVSGLLDVIAAPVIAPLIVSVPRHRMVRCPPIVKAGSVASPSECSSPLGVVHVAPVVFDPGAVVEDGVIRPSVKVVVVLSGTYPTNFHEDAPLSR